MICTHRLIVSVPENQVNAANAVIKRFDAAGDGRTLSVGLNSDGDPGKPTETRWFSWAMDKTTRDAMAVELARLPGVTIDDDGVVPTSSKMNDVLTKIGKKPMSPPGGPGNQPRVKP